MVSRIEAKVEIRAIMSRMRITSTVSSCRLLTVVFVLLCALPAVAAEHVTKIYGHRGLVGQYPENTMAGFKACVDRGLSFELDVYLTRDGVPVVIHDATVDRTTNGSGEVGSMTLGEIKKLDAGSWYDPKFKSERIPTLGEVFDMITRRDKDNDTFVAINMKKLSKGIEEKIVRLAERFHMVGRVFSFGMDSPSMVRFKIPNANFPIAGAAHSKRELDAALATTFLDYVWLTPRPPYMPAAETVAAARASRKRIVVYIRANEPERWKAARAAGVDAIATDHAVEAKRILGL